MKKIVQAIKKFFYTLAKFIDKYIVVPTTKLIFLISNKSS